MSEQELFYLPRRVCSQQVKVTQPLIGENTDGVKLSESHPASSRGTPECVEVTPISRNTKYIARVNDL